jgi:hypothetical protein
MNEFDFEPKNVEDYQRKAAIASAALFEMQGKRNCKRWKRMAAYEIMQIAF